MSGKMEKVVVMVVAGSSHQVLHQEEKASRHRASTFPSEPLIAGVAIHRVDLLTSNERSKEISHRHAQKLC